MAAILTGDNRYEGGLRYSNPSFSLSGGGAAINGGFSFDLPLATIAAFNNQALNFTAANSARNRAFAGAVIGNTQDSVERASVRAFEYMNTGLSTIRAGNLETAASIRSTETNAQQQSLWRTILSPRQAKGGKSCFITTAICELEGKPDDCYELRTLRNFRDDFMLPNAALSPMVGEYYRTAPRIVKAIRALPDNGRSMFGMLNAQYLRPAIAHIENGEYEAAMNCYVHMVAMASELIGIEVEYGCA